MNRGWTGPLAVSLVQLLTLCALLATSAESALRPDERESVLRGPVPADSAQSGIPFWMARWLRGPALTRVALTQPWVGGTSGGGSNSTSAADLATGSTIDLNLWGTDGTVTAIAKHGNTVYVGGAFRMVGPNTGGGVPLSLERGTPNLPYPRVAGGVNAAVPDGSGGWYIGGEFNAVGGVARNNLAHILADGSVAPWDPGTNSPVAALLLHGNTLYVAGFFTTLAGLSRHYIGAVDASSGAASEWDPSANDLALTLEMQGQTVYAGGYFTAIGGKLRGRIAALDAKTGSATDWNPSANDAVFTIARAGQALFVGGYFSSIGGQRRDHLAAVDARTGMATPWDPNRTGFSGVHGYAVIYRLVVHRGVVYVGGTFSALGGIRRTCLGAADATSGRILPWDPNPQGTNVAIGGIVVHGRTVFVGGYFSAVGGRPRSNVGAVDAVTGAAEPWNPEVHGGVGAIAVSGETVYVGGSFRTIGGVRRKNIAAFDAATGAVKNWVPNPDGAIVYALAVGNGIVYAGGDFNEVGGQPRGAIAALDTSTGAATAWAPDADWSVRALALNGSILYAGGGFTHLGGVERRYVGAIDATTGTTTDWNPSANDWVLALASSGHAVYAGGFFTRIGREQRWSFAALDEVTGAALGWSANADDIVEALAVDGATVYASGGFESIGGQARRRLAALDATTGAIKAWAPNLAGSLNSYYPSVYAMVAHAGTVFVGGDFLSVNGRPCSCLAALDGTTGEPLKWNPYADNSVWSLAVSDDEVYAGGMFEKIGLTPCSCFAGIAAPWRVVLGSKPGVAAMAAAPEPGTLQLRCSPNPIRSSALIRYALPKEARVSLIIYDLQGRTVQTLLDDVVQSAGGHETKVAAKGWSPGVYLCQLKMGRATLTRKLVVTD